MKHAHTQRASRYLPQLIVGNGYGTGRRDLLSIGGARRQSRRGCSVEHGAVIIPLEVLPHRVVHVLDEAEIRVLQIRLGLRREERGLGRVEEVTVADVARVIGDGRRYRLDDVGVVTAHFDEVALVQERRARVQRVEIRAG